MTLLFMTPEPEDRRAAGTWGPECALWVVQGRKTAGAVVEHAEWARKDARTGTVQSVRVRSPRPA